MIVEWLARVHQDQKHSTGCMALVLVLVPLADDEVLGDEVKSGR